VIRATLAGGLKLAGAGILVGAVGAALVGQSLTALLYRVDPHDPGVIAGIAALLALTATLACAVPAWRAASVDAATILRDE
jgi:ABC-type lipoprotein release transport system permease subunit